MHLTSILTIAALALIKQVTATICTGTSTFTSGNLKGTSYDVAWIDGEDACRWTFIANANDNPCGRDYNHIAVYNPDYEKDDCVNNDGQYKVLKTWQF
ncbi:hypothetical protein KCU85_g1947, partial [Aureobasidium melanogenum]